MFINNYNLELLHAEKEAILADYGKRYEILHEKYLKEEKSLKAAQKTIVDIQKVNEEAIDIIEKANREAKEITRGSEGEAKKRVDEALKKAKLILKEADSIKEEALRISDINKKNVDEAENKKRQAQALLSNMEAKQEQIDLTFADVLSDKKKAEEYLLKAKTKLKELEPREKRVVDDMEEIAKKRKWLFEKEKLIGGKESELIGKEKHLAKGQAKLDIEADEFNRSKDVELAAIEEKKKEISRQAKHLQWKEAELDAADKIIKSKDDDIKLQIIKLDTLKQELRKAKQGK